MSPCKSYRPWLFLLVLLTRHIVILSLSITLYFNDSSLGSICDLSTIIKLIDIFELIVSMYKNLSINHNLIKLYINLSP